jgi:putative membrane protein
MFDRLSKQSGTGFDQHYMKHMIQDHEDDAALFETEARDGQDPDLKAFAAKTLPTIKEHLQMAKSLASTHDSGR